MVEQLLKWGTLTVVTRSAAMVVGRLRRLRNKLSIPRLILGGTRLWNHSLQQAPSTNRLLKFLRKLRPCSEIHCSLRELSPGCERRYNSFCLDVAPSCRPGVSPWLVLFRRCCSILRSVISGDTCHRSSLGSFPNTTLCPFFST